MERIRKDVIVAMVMVMSICVYSFLQGNGTFQGHFENDAIAWYFLAKGLFCSITMFLLYKILETLSKK